MRTDLTFETPAVTAVTPERGLVRSWPTWRGLAVVAAVGDLVMLAWLSVTAQDRFALGLMVPILIGVGLFRFKGGTVGRVVLGLALADMTWYTVSGAVWNAITHGGPGAVFTPGWLGAFSVAGLAAVIASFVRRRADSTGPVITAGVAAGGFVVLLAASVAFAIPSTSTAPPSAALGITSASMAFSTKNLTADAGQVTVKLTNRDLSWHTFTIDSLGVDLKVPVNADGSVTFQAAPGTYEFYCSIPGHAQIGMRGTLTVR
jgi:plastocyanin